MLTIIESAISSANTTSVKNIIIYYYVHMEVATLFLIVKH